MRDELDVTNRFVLDFAQQYARRRPGARVLDYGCGAGRLVKEALARGVEMVGADVYYGGSKTRLEAEQSGLLGTSITEIRNNRIMFADGTFDLVVSNQVMEHVEDLEAVLEEIHRVLKPGGAMLSLFPSRDVLREGHIGIPLAHRFKPGSRTRFLYTLCLRRLGMGYWKEESPTCRQWALDKLSWIDAYTHYRPRREIITAFDRYFSNRFLESDYIKYRLLDRPGRRFLAWFAELPMVAPAARAIFRKLAFLVVFSEKAAG